MKRKKHFTHFFFVVVCAAVLLVFLEGHRSEAATNISSAASEHWAWNDLLGWNNFYETQTVSLSSQIMTGYASSSAGDISLDCATTRLGNICSQSDYKVINDGNGNLAGWGWNDTYGWVSFCGGQGTAVCPGSVPYRVLVGPTDGRFTGYAWNDLAGWVSMNCVDSGFCGTSDYKVVTSWRATSTSGYLDSATFDTGVVGGAALHSALWQGSKPAGTSVRLQFATSDTSNGPWTFVGPDGTSNTYYDAGPNISIPLVYTAHNNRRYFRYRVILVSDQAQQASPRVEDVIVHWSP